MSATEQGDARIFTVTKDNGTAVTVRLRKPNRRELEAGDFEQSRVFNQALQNQLPTRNRLLRKLMEGGLWTQADSDRLNTLRQSVAKTDLENVTLLTRINALAKDTEGKDKEPAALTADETQQLATLRTEHETKTIERVALFTELRQLRMEIDEMLGHTADAKAEEANRNFILACISEVVEATDGKVTKVVKRVWDSIEQMLAETDTNLMQRVVYEYMTFISGLPSEWGDDEPETTTIGEGEKQDETKATS